MKTITTIFLIIIMFINCTGGFNTGSQGKLLGSDYRIFKNTPVWEFAEAVKDGDTLSISRIIKGNKKYVDYIDPIYGQTLLMLAVYNRKYNSVKKLLELGANPNKQALDDRKSALMLAAGLGERVDILHNTDSIYLNILLKYGGDPNAVQEGDSLKKGSRNYFTPLSIACYFGVFQNVKILIKAGANINHTSNNGETALYAALVGGNPNIVLYLLNNGANYKAVMYTKLDGKKIYFMDALNNMSWHFAPNSAEYEKEQEIKDFLRAHGVK